MPARTNERRAAGWASAPAELAAWVSGTGGNAREHVVEAPQLLLRVRVAGLVGDGQMGEHPGEPQPRLVGADELRQARRRRQGAAPTRCIPVSTLRCTSRSRTRWRGERLDPFDRRDRRRQPVLDDRPGVARWLLAEQQDRHVDARLAQGDPFARQRHAQPFAPRRDRRARHGERAVPVAVGLDDGPHRRRRGRPAARPRRCGRSASRSTSAHAQRSAGPTAITELDPGAPARRAASSSRSPATRPTAGPRRAASAWIHAAADAAARGRPSRSPAAHR